MCIQHKGSTISTFFLPTIKLENHLISFLTNFDKKKLYFKNILPRNQL